MGLATSGYGMAAFGSELRIGPAPTQNLHSGGYAECARLALQTSNSVHNPAAVAC